MVLVWPTIGTNGFSMVFPLETMVFQWFWVWQTIGTNGFSMVFPLETMVFQWFPMVANHWSNDGMVTIHRRGLGWIDKFNKCILRELWSIFTGSHGRYNLTIQSMIEFRLKMIQFNFWFKRKLSKMIQFNFQFKRKLSGFNSKKIFNQKKNQDSIQKNIQFKIILG